MRKTFLWLVLLLAGCASGPATRLYLLSPVPGTTIPHAAHTIVIREVNLPRYLDRPQIVIRGSDHRLHIVESAHWGEDLREHLTRTLAENLGMRLPGSTVLPAPSFSQVRVDLRLEVEITRFEAADDGQVHLAARWRLGADSQPGVIHERSWARPRGGNGVDAPLLGTMSELVGELAQAIAGTLPAGKP